MRDKQLEIRVFWFSSASNRFSQHYSSFSVGKLLNSSIIDQDYQNRKHTKQTANLMIFELEKNEHDLLWSQLEHLENAIRDVSRVKFQCELARAIYSSSKAHFVEWIFRIFHHVHTCSSKISVSLQNLEIVESKCFKIRIQNRTYYASGTKFPSFFSNDTFPPSTWATDHFEAKIELFPIRDFEWDNIGRYLKELRECENGGQKRRNKALKESQAQFISVWTHVFRWKFTLDTLFDTPANVIKSRTH